MAIMKWLDHRTENKLDDVIQVSELCGSYNDQYKPKNDAIRNTINIE